jgi:tRNA pseudouridine38-40 synthase
MFRYSLLLAYVGKPFCGWQKQTHADGTASHPLPSVQELIEAAVLQMTGEKVSVVASGRTDRGVSALGQVAHITLSTDRFTTEKLKLGLNTILPIEIRIIRVAQVSLDFHAQRSALRKQYSFLFQQGPCPLPQYLDQSWWIYKKLDVKAMHEAVQALIGEHDFKVFQARGGDAGKSSVRTIFEAEVVKCPMPELPGQNLNELGFYFVRVRLVGSGFLKQMVRGIAGTLLQIGEGDRPATDMLELLTSQERSKVGATAAAKGLTLERVWYTIPV